MRGLAESKMQSAGIPRTFLSDELELNVMGFRPNLHGSGTRPSEEHPRADRHRHEPKDLRKSRTKRAQQGLRMPRKSVWTGLCPEETCRRLLRAANRLCHCLARRQALPENIPM